MKNVIKIRTGFSGEYRYRLTGPDGEIKQECDWKPNLLLDNGLDLMRIGDVTSAMFVGDSDAPVDVSQVGTQGSNVAADNSGDPIDSNIPAAPDWERWRMLSYVIVAGTATMTIREFVLTGDYNGQLVNNNKAGVRVVLDAPIIKGAQDQLTIQHKQTMWPTFGQVATVVNISGVPYNVVMQMYNNVSVNVNPFQCRWSGLNTAAYSDFVLPADMASNPGGTNLGAANGVVVIDGGVSPNFWTDIQLTFGPDNGNGEVNGFRFRQNETYLYLAALVTKVSDGNPITKANTDELVVRFRVIPQRYVP
jgi:hypothetical protein